MVYIIFIGDISILYHITSFCPSSFLHCSLLMTDDSTLSAGDGRYKSNYSVLLRFLDAGPI